MNVFGLYFGLPAGAVWSNLIASGICAGLVWWRARRRLRRQHEEQVALAQRHHAEQMALAAAQHKELKQQAERHHLQALDRLEAHHDALKAHVTAALRPPAARRKPAGGV